MQFFITYEGKKYSVRVESRSNEYVVAFEDEPEQVVDLHFHGNDCTFIKDHKMFYANVRGDQSKYTVWRSFRNLNFSVESEYKQIIDKLRGQSLERENVIAAKMPGKILKILTQTGDTVKEGNPVAIMEAMKMENEILTTISGKVGKIYVKPGDTVDAGDELIEVEPVH